MFAELALLFLSAVGIGFVSALAGIGGGSLIVPLLVVGFGFEAKSAIATSLLCIVVTSVAAASEYLERGLVDLGTALSLEPSTALGAVAGAFVTIELPEHIVKLALGAVLLYVSISMLRRYLSRSPRIGGGKCGDGFSKRLGARRRLPIAMALSFVAGMFSGMFGIGGGVVKVPIMSMVLGLPLRTAIATSSFMVGLTAASGGIVYALKGFADPQAFVALALGIIPGASLGARVMRRARPRALALLFASVLLYAAVKLILSSVR